MTSTMIVDECRDCRHYKRIDRDTRLCRACMGHADRAQRAQLHQRTNHAALTIERAINQASRTAASQSGDYLTNLEHALAKQGCTITRLDTTP